MKQKRKLEKIGLSIFQLQQPQKLMGGNLTPVADSCRCQPWTGNIPGWKLYQEDLDKDGKIIAWGSHIAIKQSNWV